MICTLYQKQLSSRSICSCSKAVYKPLWHTSLLSVQWINSWWWTDELSETCRVSWQNKFVKLMHLFGFIIKKPRVIFRLWIKHCNHFCACVTWAELSATLCGQPRRKVKFWRNFGSSTTYVLQNMMLQVVCFLLGNSPASEFYMPTFRYTLSVPSS